MKTRTTAMVSNEGAPAAKSLTHKSQSLPLSGTSNMVIMVSGTIDDVLEAAELILAKLLNEGEPRTNARLIVPNSSCGGIIGKVGSMIRSFIEDSGANIKISPQDHNYIGLNDRLFNYVVCKYVVLLAEL
ncbi:unnamed protein product [Lactuca virosa]|uniref:K Homology domain-containing protein n=1 Tax=Lactuca virosa TaxID=75947 RepID=A0AAU9PWR3_9ASTR|nr:unnamed protein product [Lactuca virosa]